MGCEPSICGAVATTGRRQLAAFVPATQPHMAFDVILVAVGSRIGRIWPNRISLVFHV